MFEVLIILKIGNFLYLKIFSTTTLLLQRLKVNFPGAEIVKRTFQEERFTKNKHI